MVETRSGKMQDPAQEKIQAEESAKPQPSATIGRDASSDPVVLNPNIDIPKYDGTEDPRPWIESLEEIGFLYHWADYIISRYAAMNMTGSAKTWLNLHKASFTSWENIKIRLIQDFSLDANKEELRMKLNRMQHWNEPAIRFAEDILVLCNKVDPAMEEETKIEHVIGGLKKEYSFALYLNPPKTTDDLLVVCKKMDYFEKKYRERVEKSRNLYNGPRYSRPQQQSRYVPPTAARNYQTTSRPQAPVSNNYKNDSPPTPRQYRNNFPQPSTPRRPYNPNFVPKPNLQRNTYNKSQEVSKNRTEDGRPICFKCNKPGHVARYCRVKFIRILEEDPADTQEKVEEKCQMNETSEKSGPRLYADIGTFEALVDTGADLSVVDLRTALDTGHGISKLAKICAGPDGKKLDMVGSIFLNIKIDDETLSHNFVILKTHLRTLILGRDFLKKMNAKIDCKQETIKYDLTNNHDEINFEMLKIKSAKDSIVPECSMKLIKALVETEDGEYIIEESSKMFQTNGLRLARSLINVINRETHIWITNPYPRPLKIMKNQTLAFGSSPAKINVSREREVEKNEEPRFQINENLSSKEQKELKQVLERYGDLFSSRLGRTNLAKHRIDTEDAKPIKHKPYRVSAKERDIIKEQIDEMLTEGIIRPSSSPWSFPVILVKKRDGKYRFCVDYRKLNNVTVKDVYPIPRIDEVMDTLQGSTHFSAIDLRSGYWQVEVEERDKEKTAFTTAHGLYEFNVMPFGLCNAPATFERNMENMLGNLRWQICLCYLDDVIIYSPDFPTHLKRLEAVFRCFRESNLRLNDKKCRFAFEELEILGYITSKHGIKPAEHNIKAVRNFPRPKKVKEVQSFLGMCSYYRKFIKDFSKIADPLTNLIKKSVSFTWTERQEEAFQTLKTALLSPPILGHFNPNAPTYVHTDASNIGIGATLVQDIGGEEKVISYLSRTLSKAEQNYSTTEKECLAVVWSMSKLRPYLYGRHFKIVTDHHALCWLKNLKDPTGRLARWALKIQEYDFDIIHKSGKKHLDADGLSRGPLPETDWDEDFERLFLNQITDEEDKFIESVKKNLNGSRRSIAQNFKEEDGCLFKKNPNPEGRAWLLVVPENKKREIMKEYHNHMSNGHLGVARTMYRIKSKYFWPSMLKDVSEFVKTCHLCQSRKGSNQLPSGLLQPIPPANFPFERIGIDFVGPLPSTKNRKNWIIVLSDYYIRYAETRAVSEATVKEVSKFLVEDIFLRHGAPQYLISDRGSQFTSNLMKEVMKTCKIKHCFTTSYHPQTNGLTERLNRTLINMLSMYVNTDQKNWDEILPFITHAYNTTIQETTGYSPFFLMFGREPTSLLDDRNISVDIDKDDYDEYIKHHLDKINRTRKLVINNTIKTQERMKKNYDKKHMERSYEPGELVAVWTPIRKIGKCEKLLRKYFGPYRILKKLSNVNYLIEPKDNPGQDPLIVHVSRIKPYFERIDEVNHEDVTTSGEGEAQGHNGPNSQQKCPISVHPTGQLLHKVYTRKHRNKRDTRTKRRQKHHKDTCTITDGTTTPLTRDIETIHAIQQPHNRKTLRSFLSAVNAYKKCIPDYARLRTPLNNLLKKDVTWVWDDKCQKAFTSLKDNLTTHSTLHLYQEGLPCQVYCNASTLGIAGVLKQAHPDGKNYPVQYFSRALRSHKRNYSSSELECLAIVESVAKFGVYLMDRKFTIFSDHHALQWLKTIKTCQRFKNKNVAFGAVEKDTKEKKMAENPNNRLQKFNGSKSAIRPESWIKLYDFENNSLKEDEKIKNLMYYLTDSALEWYADEIISNPAIKKWEVIKEKLIQRFGSYNANPIFSASHRRLKREESIENYFQDKIRLLNQTHLTKEEKIHLLTDGLPNDWKDLIVAAQPTDATKWFHIAASIEQNRASIQFKPKNKIHLATKNNDNRKNVCPFWCPICSKKGIKIKHWVTDCEDYDPNYKKDRPNQNTSVKQVCGAPELLNVSTLTNTPTQGAFKLINISVEVNGIPAQAIVDTGATVSIINWRLFKRTRLQLQPNSDIHISQADGVTRTCGSLQTKVRIDKLIKPVTLHVMKNFKYPLLIGLDVASLFNLLIDVRDKTIYTKFDGSQNPILVNHLEEIRKHELKEFLEHNRNVFSQHAIDLGKVAIQHKIITKSEQPISLRPYRRPLKEYEEIAEQVKELLEHKLIRTSDSPWAFPVVMVPKKDGNKRMCIDYRRLNEITLDDRQPLPHTQDMFDRLHGSRFFSTLDVAWGYWQIEMDPQSIQKTAFVTNDGELLWKGTCSFQDDILVYTKTWQEHIELLSKVFDKLRQYNMKLKLSKCIFGRTEVKYLGHIISHNQLKPDPGKVKSIHDFPRPDTVKKVRQFMGLANYYRKFVKDFSKISFPLVRLTRKNQPFIWNEEVEESFAKLKMALSTKPVLAIYNPDYPSKVYTDASKYGIGAILTQIGPDNEEHVIAYYSKTLQPHQENYSAYEMECLAVIQATDHFHPKGLLEKNKTYQEKNGKDLKLVMNSKTLLTDKEIGNELAEHFSNQFSKEKEEDQPNITYNHQEEKMLTMTTPNEVKEVIKYLANHKAPGHDNITPKIAKNLPIKWIVFLAGVFNAALHLCYYPKVWKHAIIIPIPKKSAKSPEDLRPISLLPTIGKIYERIILRRLQRYLDNSNFIIPQQFGFRRGHSTTHQLIAVMDYIQIRRSHKEVVGAVFLDFAKAFDKVWHNGLIKKLTKHQFPSDIINFMQNYLQGRTFSVKQGNFITEPKPIQTGVAQGSILGPYLFNIYINDIPLHSKCKLKLFADDTAILFNSKSVDLLVTQLQNYLNDIIKWCDEWKLDINPTKTQAIVFPSRDNKNFKPQTNLTVNSSTISWADHAKYLGVTLDSKLKFNLHVQNTIRKAKIAKIALSSLLNFKSNLTTKHKITLYKTCILPIITYALPVWGKYITPTDKKRIDAFIRICLRTTIGAPFNLSNKILKEDLNQPNIEEIYQDSATRLFSQFQKSSNPTIQEIVQNQ
ncbi:hypothetical protein LAZ67_9002947, partial [Cordylochernes scorpioides]